MTSEDSQPPPPSNVPEFREGTAFTVVAIADVAALQEHVPAWDALAASAIEPNVFYESWMLLPALRSYAVPGVNVALVFARHPTYPRGEPILCGLFPLRWLTRYKRLPIRAANLWNPIHCYLGVPLVRSGFGPQCLGAFLDWLAAERGTALLECSQITGDGPFFHLLVETLAQRRAETFLIDRHTRPLLRAGEGERYLETVLSSVKRRRLRRAEARLGESGSVQYEELSQAADIEAWISEFLELEARGWKGRNGSALVCKEADREFFERIVKGAFREHRLMMLALRVGGRPVAQLCNFLAGEGSFAFKVAFDEAYARYSPGVLLELENVRRMHARPEMRWMDSCMTAGAESIVQQLWVDRRVIQTVLVDTGRPPGSFVVAALPMARWLRRRMGGRNRRSRDQAGATAEDRDRGEDPGGTKFVPEPRQPGPVP